MQRRVACFAMSDHNHFASVLAVAAELYRAGAEVRLWTDPRFRGEVEAVGAEFADLFATTTVAACDDASRPLAARFVTFAGAAAEDLARQVDEWSADMMVVGSFAYVGRVVAQRLGIPWVVVLAGHRIFGEAYRARVPHTQPVDIDPRCDVAVSALRSKYNMRDVSPLSYVPELSPWLNVHTEPRQWLESVPLPGNHVFFGSLAEIVPFPTPMRAGSIRRVYATLGTIVWRYWTPEACHIIRAIAAVAADGEFELVVGLGGADLPSAVRAGLQGPNVTVHDYSDQRAELMGADLCFHHGGVGTTHEAIAAMVPSILSPFFADQPAEAARAIAFGVALPLVDGPPHTPVTPQDVRRALALAGHRHAAMQESLARARGWESTTLAERPLVAQRILDVGR